MAEALRRAWPLLLLALAAACAGPRLSPRGAAAPAGPLAAPEPTPTATPAPAYPQNRPLDESRPVKVRSRSLRYDQRAQETVFYGGVTVTQDSTVLRARELRSSNQGQSARASGGVQVVDAQRHLFAEASQADYGDAMREARFQGGLRLVSVDPYGVPVTVTGASGQYTDLSRSALVEGGVSVLRGNMRATAGRAELEEGGAKLKLVDDVRTSLGLDRAQSDEAVFDQLQRSAELTGSVRARFTPASLRRAADAPWSVSNTPQESP